MIFQVNGRVPSTIRVKAGRVGAWLDWQICGKCMAPGQVRLYRRWQLVTPRPRANGSRETRDLRDVQRGHCCKWVRDHCDYSGEDTIAAVRRPRTCVVAQSTNSSPFRERCISAPRRRAVLKSVATGSERAGEAFALQTVESQRSPRSKAATLHPCPFGSSFDSTPRATGHGVRSVTADARVSARENFDGFTSLLAS